MLPFRQERSDLLENLKPARTRWVLGLKKNCKESFCLTMILGGHKVEKSSKSRISLQIPIVNYNGNLEEITTFQLCDHLKSWSDKKIHYSFFYSPCTWRALPSFKFTSQSDHSWRNGEEISAGPPHSLSQITSFIYKILIYIGEIFAPAQKSYIYSEDLYYFLGIFLSILQRKS